MKSIIISPLISEKSMGGADKGKFTFKVEKTADKGKIRRQVEDKFKVNVVSVRTMIMKGKSRRFGAKRNETALSSWKKAIVQLKTGEKINMFDTSGQGEETK